mmetsp:Transcript_42124/g.106005  ORF Transcript_42124/g.106005 Transcript_42124/m.106005 type:complete len:440 (-) Transcript_42124:75-1394(-)
MPAAGAASAHYGCAARRMLTLHFLVAGRVATVALFEDLDRYSSCAASVDLRTCTSAESSSFACSGLREAAVGDSLGLLQHHRPTAALPPSTVTSGSNTECTYMHNDPYSTGQLVPCCIGLHQCLGDWEHTDRWYYLCLTDCAPFPTSPTTPQNSDLEICHSVLPFAERSIWNTGLNQYSCMSDKGTRGDGAGMCTDEGGIPDYSSIYVDMRSVRDSVGCFEWVTDDCQFQMKRVRQIDFDVAWEGCDNLWMAPFWTFSHPWVAPQGRSGEIDFVEACPVPTVTSNLGCYNAGLRDSCQDSFPWGTGNSSEGHKHIRMTLDKHGNLAVSLCKPHLFLCQQVASYENYLGIVYPTTEGRNNLYKFVSDIWNDAGNDGGWGGCKAVRNPDTICRYAVTNIEVSSVDDIPVFDDPTSKCFVLNAHARRLSVPHLGRFRARGQS